jgi:hypothetical protein
LHGRFSDAGEYRVRSRRISQNSENEAAQLESDTNRALNSADFSQDWRYGLGLAHAQHRA